MSGDLNPIFQGAYSSRIELKQWTRELEQLLMTAEKLGALLASFGEAVDNQTLWRAWEPVLFNQAHDLMCGVMTDHVWEDTRRGFEFSRRLATEELDDRLRRLVAKIDTRGKGVPLVVFNAMNWPRTDVVFASAGFATQEADGLELLGPDGKAVPVQLLEAERAGNGALLRARVAFIARDIPALGFAVYRLVPRLAAAATPQPQAENVLENELCRIEVNLADGSITSLVDKRGGWDALRGPGNVVAMEEDHGDLWELYRSLNGCQFVTMKERHPAPAVSDVQAGSAGTITRGPVFSEFAGTGGKLSTRIRLYAGLPRVEFHTRLLNRDKHVRYRVVFPTSVSQGQGFHEIPFGSVPHPEGVECPAQNWLDHGDGSRGLAVLNRGLPGNNVADGVMMVSLMRSANIAAYGFVGGYEPGMGSDTGFEIGKEFAFDYAIVPHDGDWRQANIPREGMAFNNPLIALTAAPHAGPLPKRWGFLSVSAPSVMVSALKSAEDGHGAILRVYEATGVATKAVALTLSAQLVSAEEVTLTEDVVNKLVVKNNTLLLDFHPYEIKTLKLALNPT